MHEWDKSLKVGKIGEATLDKEYDFENHSDLQRNGIDGEDKGRTVEVKTRRYYTLEIWYKQGYMDLLIETVSVVEENKLGWIYTSQAEILRYLILNSTNKDWFAKFEFNMQGLKEWFRVHGHKYEETETSTKEGWRTRFVFVPFSDIPRHIRKPLVVEGIHLD